MKILTRLMVLSALFALAACGVSNPLLTPEQQLNAALEDSAHRVFISAIEQGDIPDGIRIDSTTNEGQTIIHDGTFEVEGQKFHCTYNQKVPYPEPTEAETAGVGYATYRGRVMIHASKVTGLQLGDKCLVKGRTQTDD